MTALTTSKTAAPIAAPGTGPPITDRIALGRSHAYCDCHCCNDRLLGTVTLTPLASAQDGSKGANAKTEKRAAIRKESQATLAKLYKAQPSAKAALLKAVGYARSTTSA